MFETTVVIADDSPTVRIVLSRILCPENGFKILGRAANGLEAVALTKELRPDVVVMDIHMPQMDGYAATKKIMATAPTPIVVVSAVVDIDDVQVKMSALGVGALSVLPKPSGPGTDNFEASSEELKSTVRAMAGVQVAKRWTSPKPAAKGEPAKITALPVQSAKVRPLRAPTGARQSVIGIAASEGGPYAIRAFLSNLPQGFATPVLVNQDLDGHFAKGFVSWLSSATSMSVCVAEPDMQIQSGTVYISPPGKCIIMTSRRTITLRTLTTDDTRAHAINWLFESLADHCGDGAVALVLSGAGREGSSGMNAIKKAGGRIIAQNRESAMSFEIPEQVLRDGLTECLLAPQEIARYVGERALSA